MTLAFHAELRRVNLSPGQLLITREPCLIITVLGSCVAVTFFDAESGLGGMCHAMLAHPPAGEIVTTDDPHCFRYVSHVLPAMIATFQRSGIPRERIQAKIFGGGNVIGHSGCDAGLHWIGGTNLAAARTLLEEAGIRVAAENTGGRCGRKLLFNTVTGEVLHKRLERSHA